MPDFQKGKIYRLKSKSSGKTYIGSTVQLLRDRLYTHKSKTDSESKIIIDENDYEIELLCDYPCNNLKELRRKEGEYILKEKELIKELCVNKAIAGRTRKEYRQDHKERLAQETKEYYNKNKSRLQAIQTDSRRNDIITCECCDCEMQKHSLPRHLKSPKHIFNLNKI